MAESRPAYQFGRWLERLKVSNAPQEARSQRQSSSYRTLIGCEPVMKGVMIHPDSGGY
jgi:hypothetical protein